MTPPLIAQPRHDLVSDVPQLTESEQANHTVKELTKSERLFYHKLEKYGITEIEPSFHEDKLCYPDLDGFAYDQKDILRNLSSLANKGWIQRKNHFSG